MTDNELPKYEQPEYMEVRARLLPVTTRELTDEAAASDMGVTDVFNRALRLYHYLMEAERSGRQTCLKDPRTGEVERITIEPDRGSMKR